MADQKISELTALTGGNVADDDAIAIVDTSATETKKIVFSELKNALDTATGFVRITGDTMTGGLNVLASVGIGTSNPSTRLHTDVTGGDNELRIATTTSGEPKLTLYANGAGAHEIAFNRSDLALTFTTVGSSERMRIDSSGNVGIGTSTVTYAIDIHKTNPAIRLKAGSGFGYIMDMNSTSGMVSNILYENNAIRWGTNSAERVRLDASGNLLVGKTTIATGTAGVALRSNGEVRGTVSGAEAARFSRLSSDGAIVGFEKDGSTVGSIGTSSSRLHIENGDTGLRIAGDLDQIFPCGSGGGDRDAAIDLGSTGVRFRNLYLSGGVYLGGTGSANLLDDYEEGTHDITLNQGGVGISSTYVTWRYTKIGRMVYIEGLFLATSSGDTNTVKINLPFTYLAKSGNTADQIVQSVGTFQVPTGSGGLKGTINNNTSKLEFKKTVDNGAWTSLIGTDMASGDHIYVNLAYPTT